MSFDFLKLFGKKEKPGEFKDILTPGKKLGFGFFRLPEMDGGGGGVDYEQVNQMVDLYMQNGFNYFETAYMYLKFQSEIAIRKCLVERYKRESFIFCDKMPIRMMKKGDSYQEIFDEQLQKCGVNYFDVYLLHNLGEGIYKRINTNGGFDFLSRMKAEGKIRYIGFSFHDKAEVLDKILTEHPETDVVQLQINYLDWESSAIQSRLCYETAKKHGKPVVVMEPIKGGNLVRQMPEEARELIDRFDDMTPAKMALRFAGTLSNVAMVLSGMGSMEQVQENVRILDHPKPFRKEEHQLVEKVVDLFKKEVQIECTTCKYCLDVCPKNIPIWDIFELINTETRNGKRINYMSRMLYSRACYKKGKASDCTKCGLCENVCSQKLDIRKELEKAAKLLEK